MWRVKSNDETLSELRLDAPVNIPNIPSRTPIRFPKTSNLFILSKRVPEIKEKKIPFSSTRRNVVSALSKSRYLQNKISIQKQYYFQPQIQSQISPPDEKKKKKKKKRKFKTTKEEFIDDNIIDEQKKEKVEHKVPLHSQLSRRKNNATKFFNDPKDSENDTEIAKPDYYRAEDIMKELEAKKRDKVIQIKKQHENIKEIFKADVEFEEFTEREKSKNCKFKPTFLDYIPPSNHCDRNSNKTNPLRKVHNEEYSPYVNTFLANKNAEFQKRNKPRLHYKATLNHFLEEGYIPNSEKHKFIKKEVWNDGRLVNFVDFKEEKVVEENYILSEDDIPIGDLEFKSVIAKIFANPEKEESISRDAIFQLRKKLNE